MGLKTLYEGLMRHYGMAPTRNNRGIAHESGLVMWTRLFALPHGLPDCPRSLEGGPWRWREIPLENQRPAAYVHSLHVEREVQRIKKTEERPQRLTAAE